MGKVASHQHKILKCSNLLFQSTITTIIIIFLCKSLKKILQTLIFYSLCFRQHLRRCFDDDVAETVNNMQEAGGNSHPKTDMKTMKCKTNTNNVYNEDYEMQKIILLLYYECVIWQGFRAYVPVVTTVGTKLNKCISVKWLFLLGKQKLRKTKQLQTC